MREVLAGLFNLETLLGSPRAASQVVLDVLPELSRGIDALTASFEHAPCGLRELVSSRADSIREAISGVPKNIAPRQRLTLLHVLVTVRPELEAAVDLLLLYEQGESVEPVELDMREVIPVAFDIKAPSRVRIESARGSIMYDARILTALLRHALVRMHPDLEDVAVSAVAHDGTAQIEFTREKSANPVLPFPKLPHAIGPTDAVIDAVVARHRSVIREAPFGLVLALSAMTTPR